MTTAPSNPITPDSARAELLRRASARRHLLSFTRYTMAGYNVNWHHRVIGDVLTRMVDGITPSGEAPTLDNPYAVVRPNAPKRLIINIPPRNGKSELASRRLPAYALGRNPDLEIVAASHTADLASMLNRDVQQIIDTAEYARLFPITRLNGSNVRATAQGSYLRNNDIFEIVGRKGQYKSAGVGGPITGMGAMLGIIDDPIKNREEADSDTYREKLWRWFTSTFRQRFDSPNAAIVVMMTRWHEDDLAGRLLALANNNSKAEKWQLLSLPAVLDSIPDEADDPDRALSFRTFDQRRELGAVLWPSKFPQDALDALQAYNADDFEALQQQRPTKPGGAFFPRDNWRIIPAVDFLIFDDFEFVRGWDKAGTDGAGAFTAGVLMCYDPNRRYGVNFIIVDVRHEQYEELARETMIRNTAATDTRYGAVHIALEQEPGSSGKDGALHTVRNTLAGFDAEAVTASGKGDKQTRWRPFSAQVKAGNVGIVVAEWNEAYIKELSLLPSGKFKDQADASAIAFNKLALGWLETFTAIVDSYEIISPY